MVITIYILDHIGKLLYITCNMYVMQPRNPQKIAIITLIFSNHLLTLVATQQSSLAKNTGARCARWPAPWWLRTVAKSRGSMALWELGGPWWSQGFQRQSKNIGVGWSRKGLLVGGDWNMAFILFSISLIYGMSSANHWLSLHHIFQRG